MSFFQKAFGVTAALASVRGAYAKLDLSQRENVVVYWGQNSLGASASGGDEQTQKPLSHYCKDENIDAIVMAFVMTINGPGGAPEYDLANISKECDTFDGTNLKNCPEVGADIAECQNNGKTILLSIGGATYNEGGFSSEKEAIAGAELIWKTFGPTKEHGPAEEEPVSAQETAPSLQPTETQKPATTAAPDPQSTAIAAGTNAPWNPWNTWKNWNKRHTSNPPAAQDGLWQPQARHLNNLVPRLIGRASEPASTSSQASKVYRPFGETSVDGFDLDFEATNYNMQPFAKRLRELMDGESERKYYLTSAPQCPYPDAADKDFLNGPGPVEMDAVFVQFYNNPCGLSSFDANTDEQPQFNFKTWDDWAKDGSKNKEVKVLLGVPASKEASVSGFVPVSELKPIIEYAQGFDSFGGAMVWDVTQAYGNEGFLSSVRQALTQSASRMLRYAFRRSDEY